MTKEYVTIKLDPCGNDSKRIDSYLNDGWRLYKIINQPETSNTYIIFMRQK